MLGHRPHRAGGLLLLAALVCVAPIAGGCGCEKDVGAGGSIEQLRQVHIRYSQDEHADTCYLVAEVENTGDTAVKDAVATAVLKNRRGKKMGENHRPLETIGPRERLVFSMTVTAHANFRTVELTLHPSSET